MFLVISSLPSLSALLSPTPLPLVHLARAAAAPCPTKDSQGSCSDYWYPSGSAMDGETATIFDNGTEFSSIGSSQPTIDYADEPLYPSLDSSFYGPGWSVTPFGVIEHNYFELGFNLAQIFWGVPMNFGNDPSHATCLASNSSKSCAGLNIRQGIAHLVDKVQFINADPALSANAVPTDNPLSPENGGLPTPSPCSWDILTHGNPVGMNCVVGAPGGTAYHLATSSGGWPAKPSPDFCIAAQHFINAGLATGKDSSCALTGLSTNVTSTPHPTFYLSDSGNVALNDFGVNLFNELCFLFNGKPNQIGGSNYCYVGPAGNYQTVMVGVQIPYQTFEGSSPGINWWMWTAPVTGAYPFDNSLYINYNSRNVDSGTHPTPPCPGQAVSTSIPRNYVGLCNHSYDDIVNQMEFAPCLSATGDPAAGQASNYPGANCSGTSQLSSISAGVQAEDQFGQGAYTIPIWTTEGHYVYLSNWANVANSRNYGISNYFTSLSANSPTPALAGTVRMAFGETTTTLNPYHASTPQDFSILSSVYDSLGRVNPLANSQLIDWMTVNSGQLPNSQLTYTPPPGTTTTFRFTLRSDMYFQEPNLQVTSFDVAFSYLSLAIYGAYQGQLLAGMTGVTLLSRYQVDINMAGAGPFTKILVSSPTILPGSIWSGSSSWAGDVEACSKSLSCFPATYVNQNAGPFFQPLCTPAPTCGFPTLDLITDSNKASFTHDPIQGQTLKGSGPWECNNAAMTTLGTGCSPGSVQNPGIGQSYALQRFGRNFVTNSQPFDVYFRSNGNLAVYLWTKDVGVFTQDFVNFTTMAACFNLPVTTAPPCAHFQNGIGSTNGTTGPATPVTITQVLAVNRFVGVNWIFPFDWRSPSAPTGIIPLSPTLHEGAYTLVPCSIDSIHGYDC